VTSNKDASFFATLPGILTGIAAVITAIAGLYVALNTPPKQLKSPTAAQGVPSVPSTTGQSPLPPKTAEASSGEVILFEDDFNAKLWPEISTADKGNTLYREGVFILQNNTKKSAFFFKMTKTGLFPPNVRIEIDARLLKGEFDQPFGLLFGARGDAFNSAYGFLVRGDGFYQMMRWWKNGNEVLFSIPNSNTVHTGHGRVNRLEVEVRGKTIVYYVNGVQLGVYEAADKVQGFVGLYANWPGMEVAFDNMKITQLQIR